MITVKFLKDSISQFSLIQKFTLFELMRNEQFAVLIDSQILWVIIRLDIASFLCNEEMTFNISESLYLIKWICIESSSLMTSLVKKPRRKLRKRSYKITDRIIVFYFLCAISQPLPMSNLSCPRGGGLVSCQITILLNC